MKTLLVSYNVVLSGRTPGFGDVLLKYSDYLFPALNTEEGIITLRQMVKNHIVGESESPSTKDLIKVISITNIIDLDKLV